jgi:hypothetical protein
MLIPDMQNIYLYDRFPQLKEIYPLPVCFQFTSKFTNIVDGEEVLGASRVELFISVEAFHSSNIPQRGGHYKPISKLVSGIKDEEDNEG